jgi:hypothetical protein
VYKSGEREIHVAYLGNALLVESDDEGDVEEAKELAELMEKYVKEPGE